MLLKCSTVYDYIKYDKEYLPTDVMEKKPYYSCVWNTWKLSVNWFNFNTAASVKNSYSLTDVQI